MRTTITISDDLYRTAKAEAARSGRSVSELIEDAVRTAVRPKPADAPAARPLPVFGGSGVLPGVDLADGSALRQRMDEDVSVDALR